MTVDCLNVVDALLESALSGSAAVQQTWAYRKSMDSRLSLGWLAQRLGVRSCGILSESLKGTRRWPRKHWKLLADALELDSQQRDVVELLLERDENSKAKDIELERAIARSQQVLRHRFYKFEIRRNMTLLSSEIHAFIGTRSEPLSERDIIKIFGQSRFPEVQMALQILVENGLVGRKDNLYFSTGDTKKLFAFQQSEFHNIVSYLKAAIRDAELHTDRWALRTKESCFGTTTMSVKREDYLKALVQIKKDALRHFAALDTLEGDTVIRFNLQVYPVLEFSES